MATVEVQDNDRLYRQILGEVAKLRHASVTIGVHQSAGVHGDGPETVAQIAATHEFGSAAQRIPERSFLRSTVDGNPKPMMEAQKAAGEVCRGKLSAQHCVERIGVVTRDAVKETILSKIPPPLSPATVQRRLEKGKHGGGLASKADATTPLVDSGQLIASIQFEAKL